MFRYLLDFLYQKGHSCMNVVIFYILLWIFPHHLLNYKINNLFISYSSCCVISQGAMRTHSLKYEDMPRNPLAGVRPSIFWLPPQNPKQAFTDPQRVQMFLASVFCSPHLPPPFPLSSAQFILLYWHQWQNGILFESWMFDSGLWCWVLFTEGERWACVWWMRMVEKLAVPVDGGQTGRTGVLKRARVHQQPLQRLAVKVAWKRDWFDVRVVAHICLWPVFDMDEWFWH